MARNPHVAASRTEAMSPEEWEEVLRIHLEALQRPAGKRVDFVLAMTPEGGIRNQVLRLLEVPEPSSTFLEPPLLDAPAAGRDLGDFTLLEEIGRGGMGVVYRALQRSLGRIVAVKVLPSGFALSARQIDRFQREARSAARLSHPNLVAVITVGEERGIRYFAMEYVDGDNLAEELRRLRTEEAPGGERRHLPSSRASDYFRAVAEGIRQVAEGLAHAHEHGIVHRDIKPSNLLLDTEGRVRVVDFGLVRDEEQGTMSTSADLVGTPHYMSPEQARAARDRIDHRTDIYSLGVVMYELLTLRRPFEGKTSQEVLKNLLEREPPPIRHLNPRVPRDLETICTKAMARAAEDRYPTAGAFAADLTRFLSHEAILARPPSFLERLVRLAHRRRSAFVLAGAVLLAALLGAGVTSEVQRRAARRSRLQSIEELLGGAAVRELSPTRQSELRELLRDARSSELQAADREDPLAELEREFQRLRAELTEKGVADLAFARDSRQAEGAREDRRLSGLLTLAWAARLFPEDPELMRLASVESALPTLSVRALTEPATEVTATVYLREVDPLTGSISEGKRLGTTPLPPSPLLPGHYRVVVVFESGGFRELTIRAGPANMTIEVVARRRPDEERSSADMVRFEGGSFTFSSYPGEPCFQGRTLELPGFLLDRREVSNAEYARFLAATGRPAPEYWALEADREAFLAEAGNLPVVGVGVEDAVAFAEWSGKRLPTLAEWHRAACGLEGRPVPWISTGPEDARGNIGIDDPTLRNTLALEWEAYRRFAAPVDSHPEAASPEGILHLFGNVDELTESVAVTRGSSGALEVRPNDRFLLGGWWEAAALGRDMRMPGYIGLGPGYTSWHTGFRCARSLQP